MHPSLPPTRLLLAGGAVLLAAFAYLTLAPVACGGPVTYTRIAGTSMRPALEPGDLVLARPASDYRPGEVVVYQNPDLGLVMHRIASTDQDRLVLKGDANSWTDSYRPTIAEIDGKLWLRLPGAGRLIDWFRPPWGSSLLVLGAALAMLVPRLRRRTGQRRKPGDARRAPPAPRRRGARPFTAYSPEGAAVSVGAILLALAAGGVAAYAYAHPTRTAATVLDAYQQRGAFRYGAQAPAGIYDAPRVPAGQPVFVKLTPALHVEFDYEASAERAGTIAGTARLTAVLSQENGWERTFPLGGETPVLEGRAQLGGTVDLAALRKLIEQVEASTGVKYESYRLAIAPQVQARVEGAGEAIALAPFAPRLVFRFSATQLQLERSGDGTGNPLQASAAGSVPRVEQRPAAVPALGIRVPITALRRWSLPALAVALATLTGLAALTLRAVRRGEPHRIEAQYGPLVTTAHLVRPPASLPLISVASFDDLAAIAVRSGQPVIRDAVDLATYLVLTQEATYHYRAATRDGRAPAAGGAAPPSSEGGRLAA